MRQIPAEERLTAQVEGDIAEVNGVLRITQIRLQYYLTVDQPDAARDEKIARVLERYSEKCPAYQSVKGCIDCSWTFDSGVER